MTRDDVIRMAREAGFSVGVTDPVIYAAHERFAALVAAAEREECAALCEEVAAGIDAEAIADAIRARGQA